jgi:hypothetical protein
MFHKENKMTVIEPDKDTAYVNSISDEELAKNIRIGIDYINPFLEEAFKRHLIVSIRSLHGDAAMSISNSRSLIAFIRKETVTQL